MKKILLLVVVSASIAFSAAAQNVVQVNSGGGSYNLHGDIRDEITPAQRDAIIQTLKASEADLRAQGKLQQQLNPQITAFEWPLRQATGFTDNGYYGISNYVDENPAYPNLTLDYNCGSRTYDQSSGYNHAGTDIFTWPFGLQKMAQNAVEIIAAAPGTILYKSNGNFDQNCAFCTNCDWNAVYVMHADGSVAWYGHMKNNSLTSKTVGQTVAVGEYLGVVGSSGNSTGPHLHFEVYTSSTYTTLIDPWAGACNNHNGLTSWWANQQPYRVSTLNKIMTHSAAPAVGSCPGGEAVNEKVNFVSGNTLICATYYRDQQIGQTVVNTIYRPDNSVFTTWNLNFTSNFDASYWYNNFTLPNPAPSGTWRFSAVYNSQTYTSLFAVNTVLPLKLVHFSAAKKADKVALAFTTANEENVAHFNVLRSGDGSRYSSILKLPAKNGLSNQYTLTDENPGAINYYKLEMVDKDGAKTYSEIKQVVFSKKGNYMIVAGNPFTNELQVRMLRQVTNVLIELVNVNGQIVYSKYYTSLPEAPLSIATTGLAGGVYQVVLKNKSEVLDRSTVLKH